MEEKPPEIAQQAHTILHATEELKVGIGLLSTIFKTQEITDSCSRMKEIEGYGDDILYRAMEDLFSGKFEALEVIDKDYSNFLEEDEMSMCLSILGFKEENFEIILRKLDPSNTKIIKKDSFIRIFTNKKFISKYFYFNLS